MKTKKSLKPRPLHPFRFLGYGAVCPAKSTPEFATLKHINSAEQKILDMLASGARILFDINRKRALVYSFRRGFEHLREITVRTLSSLVAQGRLVMVGREGKTVHYAIPGTVSPSWYGAEQGTLASVV